MASCTFKYIVYFSCAGLVPQFFNGVLLIAEEQTEQSFPLNAHDYSNTQQTQKRHQDAHRHTAAVCMYRNTHTHTLVNWVDAVEEQYNYHRYCLIPVGLIGPLSILPPNPALSQNGGAQRDSQWQFLLLLQTCMWHTHTTVTSASITWLLHYLHYGKM